jgi:hypothetical protein
MRIGVEEERLRAEGMENGYLLINNKQLKTHPYFVPKLFITAVFVLVVVVFIASNVHTQPTSSAVFPHV